MWRINEKNDWEAYKIAFSWIRDMEGVPQDERYHAEGDVAVHTRMVLEALESLREFNALFEQQQHLLRAAALLHDVEKRSTTVSEVDGSITSRGHAKKGEYTTRSLLYREHHAPFLLKETVSKLVRYHGLPLWILEKSDTRKALYHASLEVDTQLLYILAKADVLGRICNDQDELIYRLELFKALCEEHDCWGKAKAFDSEWGRYEFFCKEDIAPEYIPYEGNAFEVIMLSGLPGAGKDTYLSKHYTDWPVVSLDAIRRKHKIEPTDKRKNGWVVQQAKEQARQFLRKRQSFVWNATNITRSLRQPLIALFQDYGAKTRLIYHEVPYTQLLYQNKERTYPVPEIVLERLIDKLEVPQLWEAPVVDWIVGK